MQIVTKNIEELKPFERNAKEHPEDQVKRIAESIVQYGFLVPIVITKECDVVAGHGRLLAAKYLKRKEVPCVEVDGLTQEQIRGFRIADNKVAESGWDMGVLKIELQELRNADVFTGFTDSQIEIIINPPEETEDQSRSSGGGKMSYTIVFDDSRQYADWMKFLKILEKLYPENLTVAENIEDFIMNNADLTTEEG